MNDMASRPHRWRFFRSGGFDQVRLDRPEDLRHLGDLDPKLWSVLSCPVHGLEFDARTLALLDTDGDGHIRVPEILAAVRWACAMVKDPACLLEGTDPLPLGVIDDSTPEGAALLASAQGILASLDRPEATTISVPECSDHAALLGPGALNGDGIVPPELLPEGPLRTVAREIIDRVGSETDRSGVPGISRALIERFFAEARGGLQSWQRAQAEADRILPLGADTAAAFERLEAVAGKIEDYFLRCRLATFDPAATESLNQATAVYAGLAGESLSVEDAALVKLPLAQTRPGRPLPLTEGVNPAWAGRIAAFQAAVVEPLLGARTVLSLQEWEQLRGRFEPFARWRAESHAGAVASLGRERLQEILDSDAEQALCGWVEDDLSMRGTIESIDAVERLARYHRDLLVLLNNFVSLRDFYGARHRAIFQAGRLFLDGRSCDLCLRVADVNRHGALAHFSGVYLVYCECTRKGEAPISIVAGMTGGDADNLMVGRNGIFYDREGRDWNATVVRLVEHPISIRQAFWSPYKRLARMVQEQIRKFAASRDEAVEQKAAVGVSEAVQRVEAGEKARPVAAFDIARFAGIFAAIGLAIGAIGTALAAVVAGLFSLAWWQFPLVAAGVLLAVSGPSMLLAWLKLRQRNLAPLLDANGWAVNTRARINLPFGASLTGLAELPPGAQRSLDDPYAERRRPWRAYLLLVLVLLGLGATVHLGYLDPVLAPLWERLSDFLR
jgi:hypothetical protein